MNESKLDLDIDNYTIKELLNVYKLEKLPEREEEIEMIMLKVKEKNVGDNVKNFFRNVGMRLKLEIRMNNLNKQPKEVNNYGMEMISRSEFIIPRTKLNMKQKKHIKENKFRKPVSSFLCIDSRFRANIFTSESNDFTIELPYMFNNVIELKLKTIEIVNAFTNINEDVSNNYFDISFNGIENRIAVTTGNYNHIALAATVNQSIIDKFGVAPTPPQLTFDNANGKSFFTLLQSSIDLSLNFTLKFSNNPTQPLNYLGYKLGFRKLEYKDISSNVKSEAIIDLGAERYFFVFLDDFHSQYYRDRFISITRDDFFTSNILARIKIGGGSYQVLYENNEDGIERSRIYSKPINLKKMRIKLLNIHGQLAEINNQDYSLVFEVVQKFVDD